jgi:hypothetical protein
LIDAEYDNVLNTIDSIHGDGPLPTTELIFNPRNTQSANGQYSLTDGNIEIFKIDKTPMTLTHEIGHWMDHKGFKGIIPDRDPNVRPMLSNSFASYTNLFSDFMNAANKSKKIGQIKWDAGLRQENVDYFVSNHEVWARAYSQYIAVKSGNKKMLANLRERQGQPVPGQAYPAQWDDDDFVPVGEEVEKLLIKVGWIKTK